MLTAVGWLLPLLLHPLPGLPGLLLWWHEVDHLWARGALHHHGLHACRCTRHQHLLRLQKHVLRLQHHRLLLLLLRGAVLL